MSTPDYYKYDDGETHFECFDISRYYSGDWAQVIQYVFRWQKKGGIDDLKKALACAKDARDNGMVLDPVPKSRIIRRALNNKLRILENQNFSNANEVWGSIRAVYDGTDDVIAMLEKMIKDAENETV